MKLQKLLILLSIFFIVEIITFFILKNNCLKNKEDIFHTTNTHIETKFKTISSSFDNIADLAFHSYLNTPKVKTLFQNQQRDALYNLLEKVAYILQKGFILILMLFLPKQILQVK
jgi:hypothetical protein